jgi:NADP-dependent 3-hydroxy acid dehydrogenase YdfG
MTYIAPGHIHTPKQDEKHPTRKKLDCDYIASVVKWLLSQPDDVNISEICFDRKV